MKFSTFAKIGFGLGFGYSFGKFCGNFSGEVFVGFVANMLAKVGDELNEEKA